MGIDGKRSRTGWVEAVRQSDDGERASTRGCSVTEDEDCWEALVDDWKRCLS